MANCTHLGEVRGLWGGGSEGVSNGRGGFLVLLSHGTCYVVLSFVGVVFVSIRSKTHTICYIQY